MLVIVIVFSLTKAKTEHLTEGSIPGNSETLSMDAHPCLDYDYEHRPEKHWPEHEHENCEKPTANNQKLMTDTTAMVPAAIYSN